MKGIIFALVAGAGIALVPSMQASATASNGAAVTSSVQQANSVITTAASKKRCRADFKRDRAGYCVPNHNA